MVWIVYYRHEEDFSVEVFANHDTALENFSRRVIAIGREFSHFGRSKYVSVDGRESVELLKRELRLWA